MSPYQVKDKQEVHMSFSIRIVSALVLVTLLGAPARTLAQTKPHVAMTPADLKWGPAPPVLPPGAQIAVLDGDPGKDGFFTLRLKFPDGYKIAPHWHPTDENIVIVSGTFMMGLGEKRNDASMHALTSGSFTIMPKTGRHYATAKGETVVQIYGQGPFVVNYVNPADNPTTAK
jgi:quercetin dioxygenase-like cupin family protein